MSDTESIAARLTVPERLLLFCLASGTDWQKADISALTAQQMIMRRLVEREGRAGAYVLTDEGCAVLAALAERDARFKGQ